MTKYIIDTNSNDDYFLIIDGKKVVKLTKKCNTLESVIRLLGIFNVKEVRR